MLLCVCALGMAGRRARAGAVKKRPCQRLCCSCRPCSPAGCDCAVQAVKAMRYGAGGGAVKEFEDATALREKMEEELQAALEEDEDF